MNELEYTYAVARIRALENSLLSDADIERLLACPDEGQCLQLLIEKGWGDGTGSMDAPAMLKKEEEKAWEVIEDVAPDMSVFDVLSYPKLFHNLKAAVKQVCTGKVTENVFYEDCAIPGSEMLRIVQNKEFQRLPGNMGAAAAEAYDTLLHTKDGQLCDVIVDRATLDAIYEAGLKAEDEIIQEYAESTVAIADIKIAVRSQKTAKSIDFMKRAMAHCRSINTEQLAKAAASGIDAIRDYLSGTSYAEGAATLMESPSAFERWCDNRMIETIRPQKYNTFSVGPLVAYVVARENEIKTARIILTAKQNGFPEDSIRERIREMYV
ncbi:V0D/AC39 family V-type ATPase subunit [Muricomes intestini]|uniref:V/A-type H+-transporting ATPase subunit C n=1 Tax=Muricomes intestini TaxID=1796634 RepID=A0A4R3K7L1_9FIRM|nr:V-type ATPase subunit [Muricomes intestini]TCS78835.1 V/A-type H+-transporting ATPase subunit C [Muricomes intestini]HAX51582.1 V-type ATP synthase subunit C [Lachnospiraceae bacterium]HCR83563.1 V-type ATP synthase subunit C [Lachnospiraceae bacterium]